MLERWLSMNAALAAFLPEALSHGLTCSRLRSFAVQDMVVA